jgi:hypothetical protein
MKNAITNAMYFALVPGPGEKIHSAQDDLACDALLVRVNTMLVELGWHFPIDPDTGTPISGSKGGTGDGGFRLSTSTTGKAGSKHKTAHAVDVYDPENWLDEHITDTLLAQHGLYREHPDDTPGWCHLQDIAPGSGRRTFKP